MWLFLNLKFYCNLGYFTVQTLAGQVALLHFRVMYDNLIIYFKKGKTFVSSRFYGEVVFKSLLFYIIPIVLFTLQWERSPTLATTNFSIRIILILIGLYQTLLWNNGSTSLYNILHKSFLKSKLWYIFIVPWNVI